MEYFVPRSVSEFNLSGVGDLALPPPPKRVQQTMMPITTNMISMQKPREKMVTFEDESMISTGAGAATGSNILKCPHGVPTTPSRKTGSIVVGDVFM